MGLFRKSHVGNEIQCTGRISFLKLALLAPLALVVLVLQVGCPPQGTGPEASKTTPGWGPVQRPPEPSPPRLEKVWPARAVWVVRQNYTSPSQIADLMDQCRDAGFNTVIFQVRGNATVLYRSKLEPWAEELDGKDPGFDPLEVACREAHRRGLALHAWGNVLPAWRGDSPPADARQLYNRRPEWFWYDQAGRRQPLGWYVSLNPCLPEVRQYLVNVFAEIVSGYPIDGLHLDYIRFPSEESPKGSDYPRDQRTTALFKLDSGGKTPASAGAQWSNWRTTQVTQLVRDIHRMVRQTRPRVVLTAACGHDPEEHLRRYHQDGPGWLRAGLIDAAFVMNYTKDTDLYRRRQEKWRNAVPGKPVIPGIGVYMHDDTRITAQQLQYARYWNHGVAIFSASAIFDNDPRSRQRLEVVRSILQAMPPQQVALAD